MCLDYSPFLSEDNQYVLASGGRDRLIQVYESATHYGEVNKLEGHSSSILSVKFAFDDHEKDSSKRLKLISGGADKAMIFRNVTSPSDMMIYHKEVCKSKLVSMEVMDRKIVTGHDKFL